MRIDNNGLDKKAPLATSSPAGTQGPAAHGKPGKYDSRDVVAVSDLGSLWSKLNSGYGSDRAERISRLTDQYRSGSYVVDTAAVGEALISSGFEG
jgi:anti-sigma28 factor (negative regulator of flagellin synthesis)